MMNTQEIIHLDQTYCWHPFTQAKTAEPPLVIVKGDKEFLYGADHTAYFDAASSWWVNVHGHAHPEIVQAITQQAQHLEHVMFAGITHQPAAELAACLIAKAPKTMRRVFYSDNGSTAVEVALKMAFQYWYNQTKHATRKKIIAFEGAYHGDTFGAMATGRTSGFYDPFKPWLFEVEFIPFGTNPESEQHSLHALEVLLAQHSEQIAAFIAEPLVQGASGMRMCRPEYLAQITQHCAAHNILVIFDEVMTGFGRTGTLFAAEQIVQHQGHVDLMCLSKGLTGGFLPMGATLTSQAVYDAFFDDQLHKALLHGHSYTANPLGCAAALASLKLFDQPETWQGIHTLANTHHKHLLELAQHPAIENPRQCGTIAAFEIKSSSHAYGSATSQWLRSALLSQGIIARPLGRTMYWLPPYCTQESTLQNAYACLLNILEQCASVPSHRSGNALF